ncbi:MAG: hypothetical protein NT051_07090 [Candidatus Micrarchaeota archaeon]|nr:hypothetical protein [Candidatus Micrarchaeota archaeon]
MFRTKNIQESEPPSFKDDFRDRLNKIVAAKDFDSALKEARNLVIFAQNGNDYAQKAATNIFKYLSSQKNKVAGKSISEQAVALTTCKNFITDLYVQESFFQKLELSDESSLMVKKKDEFFLLTSDYTNAVKKLEATFQNLANFSKFDRLSDLSDFYTALYLDLGQVNNVLNPYLSTDYPDKFKKRMLKLKESLPSYFREIISADGVIDTFILNSKITALIDTVKKMNDLDAKLNIFTQFGKVSLFSLTYKNGVAANAQDFVNKGVAITASDLDRVNQLSSGQYAQLTYNGVIFTVPMTTAVDADNNPVTNTFEVSRNSSMMTKVEKDGLTTAITNISNSTEALGYLASMRYGPNGESFSATYDALGATQNRKKSVADQYLEITNLFVNRCDKIQQYSEKLRDSRRETYTTLISAKADMQQIPGQNFLTRDAFDPFSRIALFKAANDGIPAGITDKQLNEMVISAKYMPPSTASILFGSSVFFNKTIAPIQSMETRSQVFNQAIFLISNIYEQSSNQVDNGKFVRKRNYSNAFDLMKKFENLDSYYNLINNLQASNVAIRDGHISPNLQSHNIMDFYGISATTSIGIFAGGTLIPNSVLNGGIAPQVSESMQPRTSPINAVFDWASGRRHQYLASKVSPAALEYNYTTNYLNRQAIPETVIALMNEASNSILGSQMKFEKDYLSVVGQGSSSSAGGKGGVGGFQADLRGKNMGQGASGEVLVSDYSVRGSKYYPLNYDEYLLSQHLNTLAKGQANNVSILGTNVFNALARYSIDVTKTKTDDKGGPVPSGVPYLDLTEDANFELNSTFLKATNREAPNGTTLVTFTEHREEDDSKTDAGDRKEGSLRYDLNVFVKKDETWVQILTKDRERSLMATEINDGKKLSDAVNQYFAQVYTEMGKENGVKIDAAGEVSTAKYGLNKSQIPKEKLQEGTRFGAMLIFQPICKFAPAVNSLAVGAVTSTAGSWAVFGGYDKGGSTGNVVYGGFFSYNDYELSQALSPGGQPNFGGINEPAPSNEFDEGKTPPSTGRGYLASGTWLALQKFKGTMFGGWRTSVGGPLVGADLRIPNANVSNFMSFDKDGKLVSGIVSAGGKVKKIGTWNADANMYVTAYRAEDYKLNDDGTKKRISKSMMNSAATFNMVNGKLTILCSLLPDQFTQNNLSNKTLSSIILSGQSIVDETSNLLPKTLLDVKLRDDAMRNIMLRTADLASQTFSTNPTQDLYESWPVNFSVGFRSKKHNWVVTGSLSNDKKLFTSGIYNFNDRVAVIGGCRLGKSADSKSYKWLGGVRLDILGGTTAFTAFVAQTEDKKLIANADAANAKLGSVAVSASKDYFRSYLFIGQEKFGIIFNYSDIGTSAGKIKNWEFGARALLGSSVFMTIAYANTRLPGVDKLRLVDGKDPDTNFAYQQAYDNGLFPLDMKIDRLKADLDIRFKNGSGLVFTGELDIMRGKNAPFDVYGGVKYYMTFK